MTLLPSSSIEELKARLSAFGREAGYIEALKIPRDLQPCAVTLIIFDHACQLRLLLAERSEALTAHPGQISFPGGRYEVADGNLLQTARRELREELGLSLEEEEFVASLPPTQTPTGYWILPYLVVLPRRPELKPDPAEIASLFDESLEELLDRPAWQSGSIEINGVTYQMHEREVQGHRIWGATARMIRQLADRLDPED